MNVRGPEFAVVMPWLKALGTSIRLALASRTGVMRKPAPVPVAHGAERKSKAPSHAPGAKPLLVSEAQCL